MKAKTKSKKKTPIADGDLTFFDSNAKAYGAFIKHKHGGECRIYQHKKTRDGQYFMYFDGEPHPCGHVSHYDFTVVNYF